MSQTMLSLVRQTHPTAAEAIEAAEIWWPKTADFDLAPKSLKHGRIGESEPGWYVLIGTVRTGAGDERTLEFHFQFDGRLGIRNPTLVRAWQLRRVLHVAKETKVLLYEHLAL